MKVVFPCKGSFVLLKQDLDTLNAFYNTTMLTSKLLETYRTTTAMIQVGNFNYLPLSSSVVLYKANGLTVEKMRKILGIYREEPTPTPAAPTPPKPQENIQDINSKPISDNDLLSNPFFQTLKPMN